MLCAPVTYVADAFHRIGSMKSAFHACARYTRPWMFPLLGHPAVHCSVTGIKERSLPGRSRPFQFCWYADTPASSRRRLVAVDVHRSVSMRLYVPCLKPVPPETVAVSGAPAVGPVIPPIAGLSVNLNEPGSQYRFSLFLGVACA